jgi:hypothetical protein
MIRWLKRMFKPDPLQEAKKEFAAACVNVFERSRDGQLIWQRMEAELKGPIYNDNVNVMMTLEGRRSMVLTIKEAMDFYHKGLPAEPKVYTHKPEEQP